MKTYNRIPVLSALLIAVLSQTAFAHDGKYLETMQKNIQSVYGAQTIEELQQVVNTFERIGAAEKTKWEPQYYAAFGYIMMANREKDNATKDRYLDQALAAVEKGKALAPQESELVALEGFVHMIRVTVDPGTRGPQYAPLAMQTFGKASGMNPENPRALSLMAQMQFGTAQFFGSPTTEACALIDKALQKFDSYKPENVLSPVWGRKMAEGLKGQCK